VVFAVSRTYYGVGESQITSLLSDVRKLSDCRPRYEDCKWDCGDTITQNFCRSVCMFDVAPSQYNILSLCNEVTEQAFA
jgi:hypothetical protein